ncbi:unnamed protein product [Effrenium voratum]|nr:unnamed protein product [Effrenium voratum]
MARHVLLALLWRFAYGYSFLEEDSGCAVSLLQRQIGAEPLSALSVSVRRSSCMAADLESVLRGVEKEGMPNLNKLVGVPFLVCLGLSLVLLLWGHRLVNCVVFLSCSVAGFYLAFELLRSTISSCTLPIYLGLAAAVVAVVLAFMFIELAIIVPGAWLGVILAYQVQAIMFTASPSMADSFVGRFYWIIAVLAALAFAYLAHVFKHDIFILVTSVLGAGLFEVALRGILLDYFSVEMSSLASLLCMVAALVVGLSVQHRSYAKSD